MSDRADSGDLVGLVRIRGHCTFTWRKSQQQPQRRVEIRASHCRDCVDEVRRLGYVLVLLRGDDPL
jgi:hypothetical protein